MYHLRRIKVLLATCMLACASLWAQDTEITIKSATADSYHNDDHRVANAIDGNFETIWHSNWDYIPKFPVNFVITLEEVSHVDYVRYTPRLSGTNGNWKVVEVSYSTSTSGTDFTSPVTYDLKGASSTFDFPIGANCGQIKFTIYPGATDNGKNLASAAEIAAYAYDTTKPAAFAEYFNGDVYSELKPGVTSSNGIADDDVKVLVEAMLAGAEGYKKFRVGEYEPYMTTATVRNNLKTNSLYNNYENPTGIYLKRGESCIIAVSGIGDYPVGLKIKDWYKSGDLSSYSLHNGLNYITATTEGNVFVDYYTDDFENAPNVQMHFINAPVLGYWDKATMTNDDWVSMLAGPLAEDDVIIITRSEHAQTAYPVKQWKQYCPDNVDATMTHYQDVQWALRDIMGLVKFNRQVKNRQLFYADKSGSMYAGGDASVCGYGDLRVLVTPDAKNFDFWGVGHEWGHNNQMAGFHWTGCGETTNNIPASWAQFKFTGNRDANGNPTNLRLEDEVTGINDYKDMRGGRMQTYFEEGLRKGVQWQLQDGPDWHAETPTAVTVTGRDENGNDLEQVNTTWRHYDHFVKLAPFWQLNLWGTVANKNPYIITKVIEAIRATDNYTSTYNTNGKQQINWMKLACEAAEMDLLPFFEKAGMLRPIHAYVDDYTKGWNIITEEMIDELKASVAAEVAAGRYQAYPDEEINYINGHNYHIYRDNLKLNVTAIQGERNGDKVTIQHSVAQNAVAFETYNAQDELIRITMYGLGSDDTHSYTQVLFPSSFDESENAAYIMAVGYDGERQRVYQTYANEDEAKYGELGRILAGVKEFLNQPSDETNTKVGYYKPSALTDLRTAYNTAKSVYDNQQSVSYVAVYDMLSTEFMKVQNDEYARVGIVEGNAYRLENKGYTGRYMSINSEKMIVGETTALTDAQKWYFEASDTEGYYYIKNKSANTYPGNVETSTKLYADKTASSEAHAYKLQDMGNGLWALVGGTGLHQGSSAYDYGIVGWDANADASQWYITAVEINTDAEALHELKSLIEKTEALIAEVEGDEAYSSISTALSQAKSQVTTAKAALEAGNSSAYDALNTKYTALLNAKNSVDNEALVVLKNQLSTLIGNTNSLINQCGTVIYTPTTSDGALSLQTTDPNGDFYLSTTAEEPEEGDIAYLVDEDGNSYFHSAWSVDVNATHYLQVDLGNGKSLKEFTFTYRTKKGPFPYEIMVYGSNDKEGSYTHLHTFSKNDSENALPTVADQLWTSSVISSEMAYRYLRFEVTNSGASGINAKPKGEYCFVMSYFGVTAIGQPESYVVTNYNIGDVTEDMLLATFKQNQEALASCEMATTEAQLQKAIAKLQAQYDALSEAKNAVQYTTFTIYSNVSGGGVVYAGEPYTEHLDALYTLTVDDLDGAIALDGYVAKNISVEGTEITVTYNKVYTVQVSGGKGNGGVIYNGVEYKESFDAPIDEEIVLSAISVDGYSDDVEITVDEEKAVVSVRYSAIPLVDTEKYYTLACKATDHSVYIRDNGEVIHGRSAEGSLFQFEKANDDNGYYIKSYVTDKYLNSNGTSISVDAQGTTVWTLALHSTGAMTLCIGNDLYLNNNGSENAACPYLQLKGHNGGPSASNACSLWTITEGEPLDKSALLAKINEFELVVNACVTDPLFVTEQLISEIRNIIADARAKYESKATTQSEYESALTALSAAESRLATAEAEAAARAEQLVVLREWIVTVNDLMARCMENSGDATQALINEVYDALQSANELADSPSSTSSELADAAADLQAKYAVLAAAQQSTAKAELRALIAQTQALIGECGTYGFGEHMVETKVGLQVNDENAAYYLSTNADQNVVGNAPDGQGIVALIDGSVEGDSYMHTQWGGTAVDDDHYVEVSLGQGMGLAEFTFKYATRKGISAIYTSPAPTVIELYGSNDGKTFTADPIATFTSSDETNPLISYTKLGEYWTSPSIKPTETYDYLRFYVRESAGPTNNTQHGGHYYFAMSEFVLSAVSYETSYYVESLTSYGNVTEEQFLNVAMAKDAAQDLVNNSYDKAALETATANLQAVYNVLQAAHNDYSYLPVTLTTDVENPVLYVMNSKRGAGKVLQYNAGDNDFTIVDATKVNEMVEANASQLFYFSKGTKKGQVYVHPFAAEGQVLAASDKAEGADKVFVAEMDNEYAMQWTFVNATIDDVEWYSLKGVDDAPYFSHHGGGTNKMGFYGSEDDGSRFTFTEMKYHKVTIGQYLHTSLYLDYATTIPEGVKAYIATNPSAEGTIDLVKLQGNVLPANTGVILYSETPDTYYFLYTNAEATDNVSENLLKGSASEQYVGDETGAKKYYIFGRKDDNVGLYWARMDYTADGTYVGNDEGTHFKASANKVYLELDATSAGALSGFRFRVGGDETGIEGITIDADAAIYDFYGRRVLEVVTPGLYIINGEKRYINIK